MQVTPIKGASSAPMLTKNDEMVPMVTEKSVQIDMDCDPGEDPKKNKRYWQHVAGLRGAQGEYLKYDLREAVGENSRLKHTIACLTAKLHTAEKHIEELKANKCHCQEDKFYVPPVCSSQCL